jgi:sugar lactone lactonase YvrE
MKCIKAFFALAVVLLSILSCKKDHPNPPVTPPVTPPPPATGPLQVTSFSPAGAAKDSIITISGQNFSTTATSNTVTINNIPATVISATTDKLTVKVPVHAGTGIVHVQVGNQEASAPTIFLYVYTVTTIAGDGQIGFREGAGNTAEFSNPASVAVDGAGNIFVADVFNQRIRKIGTDGQVSTWAGDGTKAFKEGQGTAAEFNNPYGVAATADGVVYVADAGNNRIRKITAAGNVSTLAGDGFQGFKEGAAGQAEFKIPQGVAVDANGNVYVADTYNSAIRKITPAGDVSTLAGNGMFGFQDGTGAGAQFNNPLGLVVDAAGYVFVADNTNHSVRKISPAGEVSTIAGTNVQGFADGAGPTARFRYAVAVADGGHGYIYVADFLNFRIRVISPTGLVSTIAGNDTEGFKDGPGPIAEFSNPSGIAIDSKGNIYVADAGNSRIRKLE